MTLKLNLDLDILKMYLQTEKEVAKESHSIYIAWIKKYENNSQGQKSRSKVTNYQSLPAYTMCGVHLPSYSNFGSVVFVTVCGQTDTQTDAAKNNTRLQRV